MAMQRSFIEHSTHFLRFVLILILVPLVVAAQATPDAADDSFSLVNDAPQTVDVLANDTPGVTISYVDPATSHGNAITQNGGVLVIDPAPGFEGTATFTYSVTDGSQSDSALVTITYSNPEPPPPPPPVMEAVDDYFQIPSNALESWLGVLINDTPGAVLISAGPATTAGQTVTIMDDGTIHLSGANGYTGIATFRYTIADGAGGGVSATVTLDFFEPPPVLDAVDDFYTLTNESGRFMPAPGVLENDSPGASVIPFDGQTSAGNYVSVASDGSVQLSAPWGYAGPATFDYTIADDQGNQDSATVTITYEWPNDPVVALDDEYYLPNNTSTDLGVPGLLGNDTPGAWVADSDIDLLFDGSGVVNADGSVHFPHPGGLVGTVSFTYIVGHPNGSQDDATVTIHYYDPLAAVAADDYYVLRNNQSHDLLAPGVLGNDSSGAWVIDDTLYTLFDGSGYVNSDGSLYVPSAEGFVGDVTFTYIIENAVPSQDIATVTLHFEAAPLIATSPDYFTVMAGTPLNYANVLDNDVGDGLYVSNHWVDPSTTSLYVQSDGVINFTPDAGFSGTIIVTYEVSDALGDTAQETATVTVEPAPIGCAYQTDIPQGECDALVNLYNSTNGWAWTNNTGWLQTNAPCSWYGVYCGSGRVWKIDLPANNLTGTLPALPEDLVVLELGGNDLTGWLPAPLPSQLTMLSLSGNRFVGNVPWLPDGMTTLFLTNNQFSGPLPRFTPEMFTYSVSNNHFDGSIPALPDSLQTLLIQNNQITGYIPALPPNLLVLGLDGNDLEGPLPALHNLWELDVRGNRLDGTLPELPATLYLFKISDNAFSGEIPESLANTAIVSPSRLLLCGGGNTVYSTNPAVNGFINTLSPGWSPNNSCVANQPPNAHAGADQTVEDTDNSGAESVTLDGSLSGDSDGSIVNYSWSENGTEIATGVNPTVTLAVGTHDITLTVTDDRGGTATDTVTVVLSTLPNEPPNAHAGADQTVEDTDNSGAESVTLDGSLSSDSDGTIVSYSWSENGTEIATGANPWLILVWGTHTITLLVTDDRGATATDTVEVVVLPANVPPIAYAGHDQTVIDADNDGSESVRLEGGAVDSDGIVLGYSWVDNGTEIATDQSPLVTLDVGIHVIILTVWDGRDTASDTVTVVVLPYNTPPPTADAGPDQAVTDADYSGAESVTLDGSGSSDSHGTIVSYSWSENNGQIATGVNPTVTLAVGTHDITLTVTDDRGATATDTVTVIVSLPPNELPIADAGPDQTVEDTDNDGSANVALDGSGSSDSDGTIVSYRWTVDYYTQIVTGVNPTVTLAVGTHTITLLVTDDGGGTATDTVTIEVRAPVTGNRPPAVTVANSSVRSIGRILAINGGTFLDPDGDAVTLAASFGEIGQIGRNAGAWMWVWAIPAGTPRNTPLTVTITARDSRGATTTTTFTVTVR